MKSVTVDKKWLIEQVVINQEQHEATFQKALAGYRKRVLGLVHKLLANIEEGKTDRVFISETPPTNHKRDYKRVVAMLMASVDDEVTLSADEFASYVQDDWHWKQEWNTSVTSNM
jgi:hypothetical protein